ncbi:MAG: penicillin-binding protein 2 [Rhodospirillaceae bacterium]|nr:penicillin-binding protein 2 [Rhodospirillaceae bacterium]
MSEARGYAHETDRARPMLDATFEPTTRRHIDGHRKRTLDVGHARIIMGGALFLAVFIAIAIRLVEVGGLGHNQEPAMAATPEAPVVVQRADILDRNGVVLATNVRTASLYADPRKVPDAAAAARQLVSVLPELSEAQLATRLAVDSSFVWIKRNLSPQQQYEVNRLGIPGFYFQYEEKRVYPQGSLVAHVVGFTDIDGRGLAGIEQSFDDVLGAGTHPVTLSLDLRIQHIVRQELTNAIESFDAIGGTGLVLDVKTGEVVSMVSLPDFDSNHPATASDDQRFNRATLGIYEMGSTFKIFTAAMALDSGLVSLADSFDATQPIRIGGFTISDYKPKNMVLTVPEIIVYSSNIGAAKMAMAVGPERQKAFFEQLGMFRRTSIELPESGLPMYPSDWKPINMMTIAYGHGVAVSPLHLVTAMAAMINGGAMRPATLIARAEDEVFEGNPVITSGTSESIRQLLRLVVETGTGRNADVPGYLVGGKTGTADKLAGRGYSENSRIASFIGAFPMNDPRYVVFVMVDEPKPNEFSHGYATGGWVAAPAVGKIVQRMAPLLGIEPVPEPAEDEGNALLVQASTTE